jgi:acyl-[acyl-carrier-protein]-phospholipid O-acyltransferase / long-chain-fatty-acid--[acyl-carrier-protein] ligase
MTTVAANRRGLGQEPGPYQPWRDLPPLPETWRSLPAAFVHSARAHSGRTAVADSTGASHTFGDTFLRAIAMGRVLARTWGEARHVGLFLPPVVPSAIANLAVSLWGKVPVNLNYSASEEMVNSSIEQCGITHVLTSSRVLDKFKIVPRGTLILLEDIREQVTLADKLWAAAVSKLVPLSALGLFLPGLRGVRLDEEATVIFTSGSTGDPKGVVLSHRNVLSNAHQINVQVEMKPDDVVLGILPFFHAFGFTVTLWTAMVVGLKVVYHFNPLDARTVGKLCEEHKVTILIGTPSFMRLYLKSCEGRQFATLTHLILGAEKLKPTFATEIQETLNIEALEGYGCTELSPVVAVNVPREVQLHGGCKVHGNRLGTVGLPLPGTWIKTIDPDTGEDLPPGSVGIVAVKGPQVMVGYLNRPEATAKVLRDGWYSTGDLGMVDPDGFLKITDRISRFSKIAGEMVPHVNVELALMQAAGLDEHQVAVTGVPDPKHGEKLCVLYTEMPMELAKVHQKLMSAGLPRLWVPSLRDFLHIDQIPITGTGKIDLRALKELAMAHYAEAEETMAPSRPSA